MTTTPDFLVLGAGIIGISVARELRLRFPDAAVSILEKEVACGRHASGRNSGVLHAGFYYSADSLKARFTREGNAALREYCRARGLLLNECGKLVVARSAADLPQLDELLRRGAANGVPLESLAAAEARQIEPRMKTCERAIFSPRTATADPAAVLAAMRGDAEREGVHFTITVDGRPKIGPTAIPAFWREPYHGLENFSLRDFAEVVRLQLGLLAFAGFEFRRLAWEELAKYRRSHLVALAAQLADGVFMQFKHDVGRVFKPGVHHQHLSCPGARLVGAKARPGCHDSWLLTADPARQHHLHCGSAIAWRGGVRGGIRPGSKPAPDRASAATARKTLLETHWLRERRGEVAGPAGLGHRWIELLDG